MKITALREVKPEDKLAPQMQTIMKTLIGTVGLKEPMERADLIKKLTDSGELNTRQEPARVLSFYIPRLTDKGLISTDKAPAAAKEPKDSKPADKTPSKAGATAK